MSELQVDDLSFCESASESEVQGGLLAPVNTDGPVYKSEYSSKVFNVGGNSLDDTFLSGLTKQEREKLSKSGYRWVSKDGKTVVGGASGKLGDSNFAASYARTKR